MTAQLPTWFISHKPKAILFDWDNTLVDTFPVIFRAINETFLEFGLPEWSIETEQHRMRKSLRDSFPEIFGDQWEAAREHFYKSFGEYHLSELVALEGAKELIDTLYELHIPWLAVLSNKTGRYLRAEVDHLGWGSYFRQISGATDAQADKPHTACVLHALDGAGIEPGAEVWMIGDTGIDMECARNSGLRGIVLHPENEKYDDEFSCFPPDIRFDDRQEFRLALKNVNWT